ncbi:MAG: urease accessory protein UreF [Thiotrichales bacterium]
MQLISPSLPVGGFTYSQGLEWAIEAGWITSAEELGAWLREQAATTLARVDLPLLLRLYECSASKDLEGMTYWSKVMIANRETSELRKEERNRGRAMASLLKSMEVEHAVEWQAELSRTQLAGFAHAAQIWAINKEDMLLGYVWSWLENLVLAGVKIVPLGQSAGQRLLLDISPALPETVETAMILSDEQIGASSPALSIASSQHEFQYTRLFRS